MLWRGLKGLVLGALLGALLAAGLVFGLGVAVPPTWLLFAGAALTGALVGLTLGTPFWAKDGAIEAGLKAVFGALGAAGSLWAARAYLPGALDLDAWQAGSGPLHALPAVMMPALGAVLGAFFELDHREPAAKGPRLEPTRERQRLPSPSHAESLEEHTLDEHEAHASKPPRRNAR